MTSLSLWIGTNALNQALHEADVRESIPLVKELSSEIAEHVESNLIAVYKIFLRFSKINPRLVPYLTNKDHEIILGLTDKTILKTSKIISKRQIGDLLFVLNPKNPKEELPAVTVKLESGFFVYLIIEERESKSLTTTIKQVAFQSLLAFLVSALIVFILSKLLISRLTRLNNAVKSFEQDHQLIDINDRSNDEVSDLTRSFSEMSHRINDYVNKLKEKDALRRELIAGISHDLRTPLAAIKGYAEMLQGNSEVSETISIVLRNCNVLQKLIDGLFELARLEEVTQKLELSSFSLAELLSDIVAKFSVQAEEKKLSLLMIPPDSNVIVKADPSLLERAISNLVENAILYTPPSGKIELSLKVEKNRAHIKVQDTGVGISEDDLPLIFEKFFRADRSREKDKAGSGLGLAVTKKIVEAHGGEITVSSLKESGTTFDIILPL